MKARILLLLVSLCWVLSASGQEVRPQNTMSVFFDAEGYNNCRDLSFSGAPFPVTAYFLLVSPSAPQVQSWEARIESDIAALSPGEWIINGGVNTALAPDFRVDLGPTPLPATPCGVVLLAHREMLFFMITGEYARFWVSGIPGSLEFDERPGYWSEAGVPLEGVCRFSYCSYYQAQINGDPCEYYHSYWDFPDLENVSVYTTNGEPASCILGSTVSLSGSVATKQEDLDGLAYYIVESGKGVRIIDPTPRDFDPVARVEVTGTLAVDDGEIIVVDPTAVDVTGNQYPPLIPLDSTIAALAAAYDHVGGFVRLYGEVVSTNAGGFTLTDAGANLRVEIPASLGVDPTAYQPGQVLTVSGIFSIMNGRHLIVRDAAEIAEGNVANEKQSWGGVKALFR